MTRFVSLSLFAGLLIASTGCRSPLDGIVRAQSPAGQPAQYVQQPLVVSHGGPPVEYSPVSFGHGEHGQVVYGDGFEHGDCGCDDCGHKCWFLKLFHWHHCNKCKECKVNKHRHRIHELLHRKHKFCKQLCEKRTQLEHDYKWTYNPPQGLVYPPQNQPAGVIQYPYYTVKGPTDFFYTGK